MIFNNNTTSLSSNIAMAEGYDGSCGAALALIESARNDYAMFRAMLDVDAREFQIQRESAGYVNEGELMALAESAGSGILNKIKELFKKLMAKIKAIFHTFISKIDSLYKSDKQMVKKYGKEINRKTNIGNLEVKWTKYDSNYITDALKVKDYDIQEDALKLWKEESDERELIYAKPIGVTDMDSFESDLDDKYADGGEESTEQIKDIGGMVSIMRFLDSYDKDLRNLNKKCNDFIKIANKVVKEVDKDAGKASKAIVNKNDNTMTGRFIGVENDPDNSKSGKKVNISDLGADVVDEDGIKEYNHAYEMAVAYQNVVLRATRWVLDTNKKQYKQNKAAFMKAIAANNKKLEESAVYLDAVAEAAEEEVENVISGALSKEELSKICNASLNVKDADVSDDPDRLTYGPDSYTDNLSYVRTDGSIDTEINSKSESAFFGQLLY